jgi:hypothetical protein
MTLHVLTVLLEASTGSIAIDGGNVSTWLRTLGGNLFLAIIVIRGAYAAIKARLLELAGLFVLGVLCGLFVYHPEVFQGLGNALQGVLTGGQG